jgi:hypothetical protein
MPNWCNDSLTVTGPRPDLDAFIKAAKGKDDGKKLDLCFNSLVPIPAEKEWYDWNIENWGTKWEPDSVSFNDEGTRLDYSFATAWCPPLELLQKVSAKFPTLEFVIIFDESGNGSYGKYIFKNGKFDGKDYTEEEYLQRYDEEYQNELERVEEATREEVLRYFSGEVSLEDDFPHYYLIEPKLLKKLKKKDLPLIMDYDWQSEKAKKIYNRRLTGTKGLEKSK